MGTALQTVKLVEITNRFLSPAAASAALAKFSKETLIETVRSGAGSPYFERYVNGRKGASESSVVPPGPIVYQFNWLTPAVDYAIQYLRARWNVRGPGRGGHFQDSYFVLADGKQIKPEDASEYPEVFITNDKPYARKAQVGSKGFSLPKGMYEDCRQALFSRFGRGVFRAYVTFITLDGGYVLRRGKKRVRPNGRSQGEVMRYPALKLTLRQ